MKPATANLSESTPANLVSRALCRRRSMLPMRREVEACGANQNASTGKSSSSSAGPTRKDRGHISGAPSRLLHSRRQAHLCRARRHRNAGQGAGGPPTACSSPAAESSPLSAPPPRKTRFGSPLVRSQVHWVEPNLVAEITYLTWTADQLLRQTVYVGLRSDKRPTQVRREVARGRAYAGTVGGHATFAAALPRAEKSIRRAGARRQHLAASVGDPVIAGCPLLVIDGDSFAHRSFHAVPRTLPERRQGRGRRSGLRKLLVTVLRRRATPRRRRRLGQSGGADEAP